MSTLPAALFTFPKTYDVLVCGAGHAGVEAAMAAARLGAQTAILTQNLDTVSQMSCNPAIGGLAKGNVVRALEFTSKPSCLIHTASARYARLAERCP